MEVIHRISENITIPIRSKFLVAGVDLPVGLSAFEITESDSRWPDVRLLVSELRCVDLRRTQFTKAEINSAEILVMQASWYNGYPEPSDGNEYLEASFDLREYCDACGVGLRQVAPIRLIKAPNWGTGSVFQLNWVFDEVFVKPEVWQSVFEPLGVGMRSVVLNRTGEVLPSVVQLDIPCAVDVEFGNHPFEVCPVCSRKKYEYVTAGAYPKPLEFKSAACKSSQFVGSGGSANRIVMITSELYKRIAAAGLKGFHFSPCTE